MEINSWSNNTEKTGFYKKQNTGMRSFGTFNYQFSKLNRWTSASTTLTWYQVSKLGWGKQGSFIPYIPDKVQVLRPFVIEVCKTPCIGFKSKHVMEDMDQVTFLLWFHKFVNKKTNSVAACLCDITAFSRALQIQQSKEQKLHVKPHHFIFS